MIAEAFQTSRLSALLMLRGAPALERPRPHGQGPSLAKGFAGFAAAYTLAASSTWRVDDRYRRRA